MDTLRRRFPSRGQIVPLFAVCAFPIYSWSILTFFRRMRGWLYYLDGWDVAGIFAYTLVFAFLESVMLFLGLILLGAMLPGRFLRDRFVAQGGALVLLTSGCAIVSQFTMVIPFTVFAPWHSKRFLLGVTLYLVSIGVSFMLIRRHKRLAETISSFVERLTIFAYLYVLVTLTSVVIVVCRNIQGSI